jgi:hypothetical protein
MLTDAVSAASTADISLCALLALLVSLLLRVVYRGGIYRGNGGRYTAYNLPNTYRQLPRY